MVGNAVIDIGKGRMRMAWWMVLDRMPHGGRSKLHAGRQLTT